MPFDPLAYRDPRPLPWLIRATGVLNRHVILPRILHVTAIDLPAVDAARLRAAVHPGTAAFLAPAHPEFCTDWILDKEIAHRVSPLMAHWASYAVVNAHPLAQRLGLALNLIANTPGGAGRSCALRVARRGHGVLLHPEGTATWHGDRVGPLVPGVADLALDAAAAEFREPSGPGGAARPVFIVPVVWKLHFTRDVSARLDREIDRIAAELKVRVPDAAPLEARFAALHTGLLAASARRYRVPLPAPHPRDFFAAQDALASRLVARLEPRHGRPGEALSRWLHRVRCRSRARAADDPQTARRDLDLAREIQRLRHLDPVVYGGTTLTQEQIAESLQQVRSSLVTRGLRNALHNVIPVAVAPRVARVRIPDPIEVAAGADRDDRSVRDALIARLHGLMQGELDALGKALAPEIDPWRTPNPFAARAGSAAIPGPRRPSSRRHGERGLPAPPGQPAIVPSLPGPAPRVR